MKKPLLLIFLIWLAILVSCLPAPDSNLKVHFIDVGQGDSILIDLGDKEILIDAGEENPGVVNYIRPYIDGKLEVLIATHPHADHIGGLPEVLRNFEVMDIWMNGDQSDSQTYKELLNLAKAKNTTVHTAKRGDVVQTGALNLQVLNPAQPFFKDINNNSIVLNMHYGDIDFLFMGDAEQEAEEAMLLSPDIQIPDCDVLKVGHHGSATATSQDFLSIIKPETAIYMAGKDNKFKHPHQVVIDRLVANGSKVYGTDLNGNLLISTNGNTYNVSVNPDTRTSHPLIKSWDSR
jgi:competence protein ComEC